MIVDYVEFKKQLSLYPRYYKEAKEYKRKMEDIEDELTCIPSLFPETTLVNGKLVAMPKIHGDPKQKEYWRLDKIDEKAKYECEYQRYLAKVIELDNIMTRYSNDFQKILKRVYVNCEGMEKVASEIGYSKSGLAYYIDIELKKGFNSERYGSKSI